MGTEDQEDVLRLVYKQYAQDDAFVTLDDGSKVPGPPARLLARPPARMPAAFACAPRMHASGHVYRPAMLPTACVRGPIQVAGLGLYLGMRAVAMLMRALALPEHPPVLCPTRPAYLASISDRPLPHLPHLPTHTTATHPAHHHGPRVPRPAICQVSLWDLQQYAFNNPEGQALANSRRSIPIVNPDDPAGPPLWPAASPTARQGGQAGLVLEGREAEELGLDWVSAPTRPSPPPPLPPGSGLALEAMFRSLCGAMRRRGGRIRGGLALTLTRGCGVHPQGRAHGAWAAAT